MSGTYLGMPAFPVAAAALAVGVLVMGWLLIRPRHSAE